MITCKLRFAYVENKVNEAANQGKANFDVEQIVDQLIERILDKRPLPLESDCLLDICIKVKDVFPLELTEHIRSISEYEQGTAKRLWPGCVNAAGKPRKMGKQQQVQNLDEAF